MNYTLPEALVTALQDWDYLPSIEDGDYSQDEVSNAILSLISGENKKIRFAVAQQTPLRDEIELLKDANLELEASNRNLREDIRSANGHYTDALVEISKLKQQIAGIDTISDSDEILSEITKTVREEAKSRGVAWVGLDRTLSAIFSIEPVSDQVVESIDTLTRVIIKTQECADNLSIPFTTLLDTLDELFKAIPEVEVSSEKITFKNQSRALSLHEFLKAGILYLIDLEHHERERFAEMLVNQIDGFYFLR